MASPTLASIIVYPIKSCHGIDMEESQVDNMGLLHDRRFMFIDARTNRFVTQRKYPSLALIQPIINSVTSTLDLTAPDQTSLSVPLIPSSDTPHLRVKIWHDTVLAVDAGDAAAHWASTFLTSCEVQNRTYGYQHNDDDDDDDSPPLAPGEPVSVRLVRVDPSPAYARQAHPQIPGIHSAFADESPVSLGFEASLEDLNGELVKERVGGKAVPMSRFRNNLTIKGTEKWVEDQWFIVRIGAVTFFCTSPIPRCTVLSIDQDTGKKDDWASAGPLDVLRTYHSVLGTTQQRREGYFSISALPLQSGTVRVGDPVVVLETIKRAFGRVF